MTDAEQPPSSAAGSWQEVGRQFQALGEGLAAAFRSAWENEQNRRRIQELQASIEGMAREVGQAIREAAESPEVRRARFKANKAVAEAAASATLASEAAVEEAQQALLVTLRRANDELAHLVERLQEQRTVGDAGPED